MRGRVGAITNLFIGRPTSSAASSRARSPAHSGPSSRSCQARSAHSLSSPASRGTGRRCAIWARWTVPRSPRPSGTEIRARMAARASRVRATAWSLEPMPLAGRMVDGGSTGRISLRIQRSRLAVATDIAGSGELGNGRCELWDPISSLRLDPLEHDIVAAFREHDLDVDHTPTLATLVDGFCFARADRPTHEREGRPTIAQKHQVRRSATAGPLARGGPNPWPPRQPGGQTGR